MCFAFASAHTSWNFLTVILGPSFDCKQVITRRQSMNGIFFSLPALIDCARTLCDEAKLRYIEKLNAFGGKDLYLIGEDECFTLLLLC